MMKKVLMSFVALAAIAAGATGPARAQSTTVTWSQSEVNQVEAYMSQGVVISCQPILGISVAFSEGPSTNENTGFHNGGIILYSGFESLTFTSTVGDISAIVINCAMAIYNGLPETGWSTDGTNVLQWSGTASASVTLPGYAMANGITSIVFTVAGGSTEPSLYTVKMAPGTEDSTSWSFDPAEAPTTGVAEGTGVNISYGGTRKVKSVVATVAPNAPAAPAALSLNLTSPTVGQVIGSDGKNYAYASLPTGVTALARICYVNGSNGLAMAMADEGQMAWSAAITTCEAHTPAFANGTWKLPTKAEWDNMISASGGVSTLREAFSGIGGDNLQSTRYWSATEDESNDSNAYNIMINDGGWATFVKTNVYRYVRAVLAW